MDIQEQHDRGLALRTELFGREAVEKRMNAFGEFGKPLQHVINAYAYGDVWQRSALPLATKSLVMVGMMAAAGHPERVARASEGRTEERLQRGTDPGGAAPAHALLRHSGGERGAPRGGRRAARGEAAVTIAEAPQALRPHAVLPVARVRE